MNNLSKILAVFLNLANYGVGIAVSAILLFKLDFISVFYFGSMTTNESLFFNMIMFQIGIVLASVVLSLLVGNAGKKDFVVEFPPLYMLLPIAVSIVGIVFAISGETTAEKIFVIAAALLYSALSAVVIFSGTRIFQLFESSENNN